MVAQVAACVGGREGGLDGKVPRYGWREAFKFGLDIFVVVCFMTLVVGRLRLISLVGYFWWATSGSMVGAPLYPSCI